MIVCVDVVISLSGESKLTVLCFFVLEDGEPVEGLLRFRDCSEIELAGVELPNPPGDEPEAF